MTTSRIEKIADFLYSSNSSKDVPLRISVTYGMAGVDLSKQEFVMLMYILSNSIDLKRDLYLFSQNVS